jgi:hypothetical protein
MENIPNYFTEMVQKINPDRVMKNIVWWNSFVDESREKGKFDWPNVIVLNKKLYIYHKTRILLELDFNGSDEMNRDLDNTMEEISNINIHSSKKCYNIYEAGEINMINALENENMIAIKVGNQFQCIEVEQIMKIYNKMNTIDETFQQKLWYRDSLVYIECPSDDKKESEREQFGSFQLVTDFYIVKLTSYNKMIMMFLKDNVRIFELIKDDNLPKPIISKLGYSISNSRNLEFKEKIRRERMIDGRTGKYYCDDDQKNNINARLAIYKIKPYKYIVSDDGLVDEKQMEIKMSDETIRRNQEERQQFLDRSRKSMLKNKILTDNIDEYNQVKKILTQFIDYDRSDSNEEFKYDWDLYNNLLNQKNQLEDNFDVAYLEVWANNYEKILEYLEQRDNYEIKEIFNGDVLNILTEIIKIQYKLEQMDINNNQNNENYILPIQLHNQYYDRLPTIDDLDRYISNLYTALITWEEEQVDEDDIERYGFVQDRMEELQEIINQSEDFRYSLESIHEHYENREIDIDNRDDQLQELLEDRWIDLQFGNGLSKKILHAIRS